MKNLIKRVVFVLVAVVGLSVGSTGCINQYASEPNTRMDQLLNESEDYRQIGEFWRRFWFNEMPSHMTPERIHGGIM